MQGKGGHLTLGLWCPSNAAGATPGGCWRPAGGGGVRRGIASGSAGVQRRAAGAHYGTAQDCSLGLCRGAACGCARVQCVPAQQCSIAARENLACGCVGMQRGAAKERSLRLLRGTTWGRAEARHGAARGHIAGLHRGAVWGCARTQRLVV